MGRMALMAAWRTPRRRSRAGGGVVGHLGHHGPTHLHARGECLLAGQVVMTGSLVPTRFPSEDTAFRYELAGIGTVSVNVTA